MKGNSLLRQINNSDFTPAPAVKIQPLKDECEFLREKKFSMEKKPCPVTGVSVVHHLVFGALNWKIILLVSRLSQIYYTFSYNDI